MANRMFKLISNQPTATLIRVGDVGGDYLWSSGGVDAAAFGIPKIQPRLSDPDDVDEFIRIGNTAQVRSFSVDLQVKATSPKAVAAKLATLIATCASINEWGGTIRYRGQGMDYPVELKALDIAVAEDGGVWSHAAEAFFRQSVTLNFTVQPWAKPDPLRILEQFATDTLGTGGKYDDDSNDWDTVAGRSAASGVLAAAAITNWTVAGARLTPQANLTTELRLIHTGTPWKYRDPFVNMIVFCGDNSNTTIPTGVKLGGFLKWIDADNYIEMYCSANGTAWSMKIDIVRAGTRTTAYTASQAPATPLFQMRAGIRGNRVYFGATNFTDNKTEFYEGQVYAFSAAETAVFGAGIAGNVGMSMTAGNAVNPNIISFEAQDGLLFGGTAHANVSNEWLGGTIPKVASTTFRVRAQGMNKHMGIGWWNRRRAFSMLPAGFNTTGWSAAAVTGVNAAGNGLGNNPGGSSPAYGGADPITLGCGTVNGGGCNFFLGGRRFKKGVTYRFRVRINRSTWGLGTAVVAKLGVNGDIASSSSVIPTTTWQTLIVDWTPTADRWGAYIAITGTSTTQTTMTIAEQQVWETSDAALAQPIQGPGGHLGYGIVGGSGYVLSATMVETSDVQAVGATTVPTTNHGSAACTVSYPITTHALDEPDGDCVIDVLGMLDIPSTAVACKAYLSWNANPNGSSYANPMTQVYSEPFGSSGKTLVPPASGTIRKLVYLGRITLPAASVAQFRLLLTLQGALGVGIEYLALMPARSSILTPSGIAEELLVNDALVTIEPDLEVRREGIGASDLSRFGGAQLRLPMEARVEACYVQSPYPTDIVGAASLQATSGGCNQDGNSLANNMARPGLFFEIQPRTYLMETS